MGIDELPYMNYANNPSMQMCAVSFAPQLPWAPHGSGPTQVGSIPTGAEILENNRVRACLYAPQASAVTVFNGKSHTELKRDEGGAWSGIVTYDAPGFKPLDFHLDGNLVLNPLAPIGFGGNRAINYVDIPDLAQDFLLLRDVPHGTVAREFYFSSVTGKHESCLVYLPPDYFSDTEKQYPVLYLQHGGGENENGWIYQGKVNFTADNLIAAGEAEPCLIVMNAGMTVVEENGEKRVDYARFEDVLLRDCIPFIERKFRTKTDSKNRAYAGLSMGSLQGGQIVMRHPEYFGAAGLFTGFLYPNRPPEALDYLSALDDAERFNNCVKVFFRCMGTEEISVPLFELESEMCRKKGIRFIECHPEGAHEWRVWRQCAYEFLKLIFRES